MNARLNIIGPIGFDLGNNAVRRAGLDHWDELHLSVHINTYEFLKWLGDRTPWLVTKHGSLRYDTPDYKDEDIIVFGSETKGLPEDWLNRWSERTLHVPIMGNIRSYNLANTVSVLLAQASLSAGIYDQTPRPHDFQL